VRAIGICAVKIERAANRCIEVLLDLIQTKVNYVVQEAIVVIKVPILFYLCILETSTHRPKNSPEHLQEVSE